MVHVSTLYIHCVKLRDVGIHETYIMGTLVCVALVLRAGWLLAAMRL